MVALLGRLGLIMRSHRAVIACLVVICGAIVLTGKLYFTPLPATTRTTYSETRPQIQYNASRPSADSGPQGTRQGVVFIEQAWATFRESLLRELTELLRDDVTEDDPRLVDLIRRYLFPPSRGLSKMSYRIGPPPQAKVAMELYKKQKGGFFVECGALDGERSSNTLHLEKKGWTGLLIEADPYYFLQVLGKKRRAWALNACLSITGKPSIMNFKESDGGLGKVAEQGQRVACFPLYSILKALNRTRVDFFSLDVEGAEMAVLRTTPFEKLDIRAITMEYVHNSEKPATMKEFMVSQGYELHKKIDKTDIYVSLFTHDLFFVKKGLTNTVSTRHK